MAPAINLLRILHFFQISCLSGSEVATEFMRRKSVWKLIIVTWQPLSALRDLEGGDNILKTYQRIMA